MTSTTQRTGGGSSASQYAYHENISDKIPPSMYKKLQRKNEEFIQNHNIVSSGAKNQFKVTPKRMAQFKVTDLLNQESNEGLDIGGGEVNVSFNRDNIRIVEE